MDIFSILEFFMNMQKMKKAEALGQTNIGLDLAGKMPGGLGEVAEKFPTIGAGMRSTLGAPPKSQVMGDYPMSYFGAEQPSGFEAAKPMMTQKLSPFGKPSEVPLTREVWPQLGLTHAEQMSKIHADIAKENLAQQTAGNIAAIAKGWVKEGPTPGTTQNLSPEEQKRAATTGYIDPSWTPRAPQAPTGGIEWTRMQDMKSIAKKIADVGGDPGKLAPEDQSLANMYDMAHKVGDKWVLKGYQEAQLKYPVFDSQEKAVKEGARFAPEGHNAVPHPFPGGWGYRYEVKPGAGPLPESYTHGLQEAAAFEYLPKAEEAVKANRKKLGTDEIHNILASFKDPYTGRPVLHNIAMALDETERANINKRIVHGTILGRDKQISSWNAWKQSEKILTPAEAIGKESPTGHKPTGATPMKSKEARIAELVAENPNITNLQIKATLKKEKYPE